MLTRLKVSGFKNLVNVDIRFGPFTCIAGANGAGKSNLFDAIRFLSALATKPLNEATLSIRDAENHSDNIRALFHRHTLLADGSSNTVLLPILTWLLKEQGINRPIISKRADFGRCINPPKKLTDKISRAQQDFPCDLLFIHRDAEKCSWQQRFDEINNPFPIPKASSKIY